MKSQQYIKTTKISSLPGQPDTLDKGYWAIGQLINDVEIGKPLTMWRISNILYPTGRAGKFNTSTIKSILRSVEGDDVYLVETDNSIYQIDNLIESQAYNGIGFAQLAENPSCLVKA